MCSLKCPTPYFLIPFSASCQVFFFKACYVGGSLDPQCPDYRWVAKEEVRQFSNNTYGSKLKNLVLE